uniref:Actinodin2 n=1 Tax=Esox lucius TaxID=8010 RepID=A0A3P8XHQ6_ESOLU
MAQAGRLTFSLIYTGILLVLLPELLGALPVEQKEVSSVSSDVRSKRSLSYPIPVLKRVPDFWGWYKYFMDSGNQEGIEDLDKMYMSFLQNKHRSEEAPSFNHYLNHLSAVYKTCADSDNPECIAESTSKPKAKVVMPAPIKTAAVTMCNPYIDPYCLFPMIPKMAAPEPPPTPGPAPVLTPFLPHPMKSPAGFYYYAPVLEPFLSDEQKAELLRICNPDDTECLQYHLRAAYGYKPAPGPAPSYSALGCDPNADPYCRPQLVKKAPSGYFHLYPSCDPATDPLCVEAPAATPKEQHCNPLFDKGCNPLTATKLAGLTKPVLEYKPKNKPAQAPAPLTCDPRYDPFCLLRAAAAHRLSPQFQTRSRLGIPGKTKEGHACYVHYDEGCVPVEASDEPRGHNAAPPCHPYDFTCNGMSAPAPLGADQPKTGVILPDPHCDPEYDYNCRLRRAEDAPEPEPKDEPARQEAVPRIEDFLRSYMTSGQYRKKQWKIVMINYTQCAFGGMYKK